MEQSGRGWTQTSFAAYGGGLREPGPDGGGSGSSGASVAPMRNRPAKPRYRGSLGRNHPNSAGKPSYAGRRRRRQPPYPRIRRFCSVIPSTPQTSPQIALANCANSPSPTREPGHATLAPLLRGTNRTRMGPDLLRYLWGWSYATRPRRRRERIEGTSGSSGASVDR